MNLNYGETGHSIYKKLQILSNIVIVQSNSNIGFVQVPVSYKKSEHFHKKRFNGDYKKSRNYNNLCKKAIVLKPKWIVFFLTSRILCFRFTHSSEWIPDNHLQFSRSLIHSQPIFSGEDEAYDFEILMWNETWLNALPKCMSVTCSLNKKTVTIP